VRGDSLRDLYAKTIALVGLALLAAVGALFDYWPLSNDLPRIAGLSPLGRPVTAPPLPVPDAAVLAERRLADVAARRVARSSRPATTAATVVATVDPAPAAAELTLTAALAPPSAPDLSLGTPVALVAPILPLAVATAAADRARGPVVALSEPPIVESPVVMAAPVPAPDSGSALDAVTGAFKSAGQTIVRTGVKTGASIRDAFLFFGGAFKKIL
jgi:hypothetical protein